MAYPLPDTLDNVSDHLSDYMKTRTKSGKNQDASELLEAAIAACYGSKKIFFNKFLAVLSEEQVKVFFELLNRKMKTGYIDPKILESIRNALKKAGVSEVMEADGTKVVPSTNVGQSPYDKGKRGR